MLDWLPIYPARVVTVVLLGAAFQPYYASNTAPLPSIAGWQAKYPDRIERKVQHVSQKPALFQAGRVAIPDAVVPPLSWDGEYPALLNRRRLPVAAVPALFSVPFARATELTQQPSYPDRIYRDRVHPARVPFSAHKLEAIPVLLSWKGEQPERVWPKPRVATGSQPAFHFYPVAIPAPLPPGLGYTTVVVPPFIRPKLSVPLPSRQTFSVNVVPIPNPPPPTNFSWPPSYPDFTYVLGATEATSDLLIAPLLPTVVSNLQWLPIYPTHFPLRTRRQDGLVAPLNLSALPAIASELAWLPTFPDRPVRAKDVNEFVGFDPLSAVVFFPTVPGCVEVFDEILTTAAMVGTVVHASVTDETVTGSALSPEETC